MIFRSNNSYNVFSVLAAFELKEDAMKNKIVILTASLVFVFIMLPIGAMAVPIYLNQSNVSPDGQIYATVQINFETEDYAIFEIDVNESLLAPVPGLAPAFLLGIGLIGLAAVGRKKPLKK